MTFTLFIKALWGIAIGATTGIYFYTLKRDHYLTEDMAMGLLINYVLLGVCYLCA